MVISESATSKAHSEGMPAAMVLRWRISKDAGHLATALKAMQRGDASERQGYAGTLIDEGMYTEAELLLASQIDQGDPIAKLLISDARVRSGNAASARELLFTIRPDQVPNRLRYAYAVACSLAALSSGDAEMRRVAVRAIQALPPSAQDGDETLRTLLRALERGGPGA